MDHVSEHVLCAEVAAGTFCFKNKVPASAVSALWAKLASFIVDALKQQKGVLVPHLGTFRVGPVVGDSRSKVRPAFTLLEGRYNNVSQERPKTSIGGRCPIIQPNYGMLATAAAVHRGVSQRLLQELVQRLGVHILSGRPVQVMFPGLGRLFTNRANRIEFSFDPLIREYFELARHAIVPEMAHDYGEAELSPRHGQASPGGLEEGPVVEVVKGLQQVHIHHPPSVKSRPVTGTSAAPSSPSARVRRHAHAPYKGPLLELHRLCASNDRINSGCVPRLQLEAWLAKECAALMRQVAASTVLELLSVNTYGKTGRHVLYKPFLDGLEAAIGNVSPEISPRSMPSPRRILEVRVDSPSAASTAPVGGEQRHVDGEGGGPEVTFSPAAGMGHGAGGLFPPPPLDVPHTPALTPGMWAGAAGPVPDSAQQPPNSASPQLPHHYYQHHLSPRSRKAFDSFNKVHFDKLQQVRGPDYKRAVTPKVGEEQLNLAEYQFLRQAGERAPTPAEVLGLRDDPPYSRGTPAPGVVPAPRRGSPGPQPQIFTLAHESPSPPQPQHYHQYNQQYHYPSNHQAQQQQYPRPSPYPSHQPQQQPDPYQPHMQQQGPPGGYQQRQHTPEGQHQVHYAWQQQQPMPAQQRQQQPPNTPGGPMPWQQQQQQQQPPSRSYTPGGQLLLHQAVAGQGHMTPMSQASPHLRAHTPGSARGAPPGSARAPTPGRQQQDADPPISQYDIINESNPVLKQRKRVELAQALQSNWTEQIKEKERVLKEMQEAEEQWPYAPMRQPNDKRPSSAVRNRPGSGATSTVSAVKRAPSFKR